MSKFENFSQITTDQLADLGRDSLLTICQHGNTRSRDWLPLISKEVKKSNITFHYLRGGLVGLNGDPNDNHPGLVHLADHSPEKIVEINSYLKQVGWIVVVSDTSLMPFLAREVVTFSKKSYNQNETLKLLKTVFEGVNPIITNSWARAALAISK